MSLEDYKLHILPGKDDSQWINTLGWHRVDAPARMLGDKINTAYGRVSGTVDFVLFEDERDAIMYKLTLP
jgi:hypothetical protein